jgi:tRNA threonylcarbamoyladenosine biosynthesis protein TsaB
LLLAVDTSTRWMGVALYDGVQVLGEQIWQTKNRHTVELAPAIQTMLEGCGVEPSALKALAVAMGPGSFTGLRIGMAIVKGLALGLRIPVVGVPTLDILAASQPVQDLPLIAVLQSGRGRLAMNNYANNKGKWSAAGEAMLTTAKDLAEMISDPSLICGELTSSDRQQLKAIAPHVVIASPAHSIRRPSYLAELAWESWQAGRVDDIVSLSPIYLHVTEGIDA